MMKLYYLRGALGDSRLIEAHEEAIERLLHCDYNSSDLEKLTGHEVYSFRLNRSARLLFAVEQINGQQTLVVLDYLPRHQYNKSSFLRSGILKKYLKRHEPVYSDLVNKESSFVPVLESERPSFIYDSESKIEYQEIDYYQSRYIELNAEQQEGIHLQLPALCSGIAGSGKSCVALTFIVSNLLNATTYSSGRAAAIEEKAILYVTHSDLLLNLMRSSYEELPIAQKTHKKVLFKTYNQLVIEDSEASSEHWVGETEFQQWYKKRLALNKKQKKTSLCVDPSKVYQEFRVVSGYSAEAYNALSDKESSLSKSSGQRSLLYTLYIDYLHFLDGQIDPCLYTFKNQNSYDLVVVDEAQDCSHKQLQNLFFAATDRQVLFFMDSHQRLNDYYSVRPYVLNHFAGIEHVSLQMTYRTPPRIAAVANEVIRCKHHLTGGLSDRYEPSQMACAATGSNLGWAGILSPRELVSHSWLKKHMDKPYCAIVTLPAYQEEARRLFPESMLIMTPAQIKGLEYDLVITYKLYNEQLDGKSLVQQVKTRLSEVGTSPSPTIHRPKKNTADERFSPFFNALYTSYTRSKQILIVCEPDARDSWLLERLSHLMDNRELSDTILHESFIGLWEEQVIIHYHAGNKVLAELIFTNKLNRALHELPSFVGVNSTESSAAVVPEKKELSIDTSMSSSSSSFSSLSSSSPSFFKLDSGCNKKRDKSKEQEIKKLTSVQHAVLTTQYDDAAQRQQKYINALENDFTLKRLTTTLLLLKDSIWHEKEGIKLIKSIFSCPKKSALLVTALLNCYSLYASIPKDQLFLFKHAITFHDFFEFKEKVDAGQLRYDDMPNEKQIRDLCNKMNESPNLLTLFKLAKLIDISPSMDAISYLELVNPIVLAYKNEIIHHIIASNNKEKLLLWARLGADLNKANDRGHTPAHYAVNLRSEEMLIELKALGADLNKEDRGGTTPAMLAIYSGKINMLRVLKDAGVNLNALNKEGNTVAHYAMLLEDPVSVLRSLRSLGLDLEIPNYQGDRPVNWALDVKGAAFLRMLHADFQFDLNKPNQFGYTLLHQVLFADRFDLLMLKDIADLLDWNQTAKISEAVLRKMILRSSLADKLNVDESFSFAEIELTPYELAQGMGKKDSFIEAAGENFKLLGKVGAQLK